MPFKNIVTRANYTRGTREERFWAKVDRSAPNGCWQWTGALVASGYGHLNWERNPARSRRAHRVAWEMLRGEIPKGMHLLHSCDNPGCVNPDHLRPGTDADNTMDRMARGRSNIDLSVADVRAIVFLYRVERLSSTKIASMFNTSHNQVLRIAKGQSRWIDTGLAQAEDKWSRKNRAKRYS